jgi:DNA-directed RNA polymerase subunit F
MTDSGLETLRDRNNTSFPRELYEILKKIAQKDNDPLQYHQRLAHDYLLKYPHIRGVFGLSRDGIG